MNYLTLVDRFLNDPAERGRIGRPSDECRVKGGFGDGGATAVQYRLSERIIRSDYEAVIAEFIRTKGITRCPTACVLPTQGSIDAADQAALEKHAVAQERLRQAKAAARARLFWNVSFPPPREK